MDELKQVTKLPGTYKGELSVCLLHCVEWGSVLARGGLPSPHPLCCVPSADPDGLPALADKQKSQLQGWVRPDDICDDPKMIKMVSSMAIKQVGMPGEGH